MGQRRARTRQRAIVADLGSDMQNLTRSEEILALTEEGAPLDVSDADMLAARLPMLVRDTQEEDEGAGCASGVTGWPWKKVDVP